jgi:hypothetical protein
MKHVHMVRIVKERNKRLRQASNMYERTSPRGVIASFHYLGVSPIQQKERTKKEKNGASPI